MKIINVASKTNPLAKCGGLVMFVFYSLSHELAKDKKKSFEYPPILKSIKEKNIEATYFGYDYIKFSWIHQNWYF